MSQPTKSAALAGLVLAVALSGAHAAQAETTNAVPANEPTTMNFVGEWPVDNGVRFERSGVSAAGRVVASRYAAGAGITCGSTDVGSFEWAFARIASLWRTTLNTVRAAWDRVHSLLRMPE